MAKNLDNSRLYQVIALYLASVEHGNEPDRDSFLAEHSEFQDELKSFFLNHDAMRSKQAAGDTQEGHATTATSDEAVRGPEKSRSSSLPCVELGEYTIVSELGAGGMGRVYLALHRRMKRQVAIKFLPSETAKDEALVRRFHREVEVAAQLTHPNIVAAHDAGQQGELHYLVLEYVDGIDFGSLVRQLGPLTLEDAIRCVVQAGQGIEYAHQKDIIHRDIKPANLLLRRDGVVKVLDMGLARWNAIPGDSTASDLSSSGLIMGTVDYMAPEQAADSKSADQRSDLYSLGCTLYNLFHGEPLYPRDSVIEKLLAHREADLPDLVPDSSSKSRELNDAFRRMVAKQPVDRFDSIKEACHRLLQILDTPDTDLAPKISIPHQGLTNPQASTIEKERAEVLETTRMSVLQQKRVTWRNRTLLGLILSAFLLVFILSLPFVLRLVTPEGTLVVKCFVDGAIVEIDGERKAVIETSEGEQAYEFSLPKGEHLVRVTMPDGTVIKSESVTIESSRGIMFQAQWDSTKNGIDSNNTESARLDLNPEIHIVSQDGSGEYTSLNAALAQCQPNHTIQVIDDSDYFESLILSSSGHEGLTIEFTGNAGWHPKPSTPGGSAVALNIRVSNVKLRGIRFELALGTFGVGVVERCSNVRVEECRFESSSDRTAGVSIEGNKVPLKQKPIVVTKCQFKRVFIGVRVSGSLDALFKPYPINDVLIYDNTFEECSKACLVFGETRNLLMAGNVVSKSTFGGFQFQHLLPGSTNILAVNNSFFDCESPIRIWEKGIPEVRVELSSNLVLSTSRGPDFRVYDSGGSLDFAKGMGDGEAVRDHWILRHNFRETDGRSQQGWIPPSDSEQLLDTIPVVSRDLYSPDFLRPIDGSSPASGGLGGMLPSYVGAVPPAGVQPFDWETFYFEQFRR